MCGIGAELVLYVNSALLGLGLIGFTLASFHFKDDLKDIFKKENKIVI